MSKEVPPGGDTINGQFVPAGTKIGYGMYGIFRDKKLWGNDPSIFRPERWLEEDADKLKEMDSALELIFGYGKYKCLGSNVAMMELNKVFVEVSVACSTPPDSWLLPLSLIFDELFRQFDFNIVNPMKPMRSTCHGIFFQSEFWLTAYERL